MSITLSYLTTTIELHPDLYWADENEWQPVEQQVERTITGGLIVSTALRVGGRTITLRPIDERSAWLPRATIETLRSWAAVPGRQMTLTLRGVSFDVIFRHQDGAIEATPIVHYNDVVSTDFYSAVLRFMEI